jgi:DNA-binding NarL/FixJ family response regulator
VAVTIRVAVVEEHEIFRRGLVTCLAEDPAFVVVTGRDVLGQRGLEHAEDPEVTTPDADVAVVSATAAGRRRFECPLVLCVAHHNQPRHVAAGNFVASVLYWASLTEVQLHATVRAAAAGLRINAERYTRPDGLDDRALRVLRLLADGRSTHEIACDMSYSERTIKAQIQYLERRLRAHNRAQVVAHAIRQGLI